MAQYNRHMAYSLWQSTPQQRIQAIKEGLPYQDFESLSQILGLSAAELAQIIGVPARTLQRRRQQGHFASDESDRLFRVLRLVERASEVLGDSGILWLKEAKRSLAGQSPLQFADTEAGAWEIHQMLGRLEHGVFL